MKRPQLLALAIAAISITACNEPDTAETDVATTELPRLQPAIPPQNFSVSGQHITFLGGQGHMRIPDGWQQVMNSDKPIAIEAKRYLVDPDRRAVCSVTELNAPNFALVSQQSMNRYIETLWSSISEELESEGTKVEVTYPTIGENLRSKAMSYTFGGVDFIMQAVFVMDGNLMHAAHVSCDVASPATEEDRTDIAAFGSSFRFDAH